jgi:chromosome segregation ATPase
VSNLGQHDGDGIRYAMHLSAPKGGTAQMLRDPAGGWVSWEDYARLKAEVERLTSDLQMEKENEDRLVREWQKANNEVYGLKTQVAALIDELERLRKGGQP